MLLNRGEGIVQALEFVLEIIEISLVGCDCCPYPLKLGLQVGDELKVFLFLEWPDSKASPMSA